MRAAIAAALLVAACGGKSTPTPTTPTPDNGGGDPTGAVYAKMFEMGASWTFDVHTEDSDYDDEGEPTQTVDDFQSTCHVERVSEIGGVHLSEVLCDESWPQNGGGDLLSGVWASNADGAWHLSTWPEDGAEVALDVKERMFAAVPVEDTGSEEDEMSSSSWSVSKNGDAWCYEATWSAGDDGWTSICLDGTGPTEGTFGWGGGTVHDTRFQRAK